MADQAQNTQAQQIASEWEKFVTAQSGHVESLLTEIGKLETKAVAQALDTWEQAGRYAKESFAVAERVSAEWRKLALETARRTTQLITPKL